MHQVCRKYQGLPWTPPREKGMEANLRALVNVDVQPNPVPMDPDVLAVAFEARAHPKLVSQMTHESLVLRQKSRKGVRFLIPCVRWWCRVPV